MEPTDEQIRQGMQAFVDHMGRVSLCLCRFDTPAPDEKEPAKRGSGLAILGDARPLVVSCEHVIGRGRWGVEGHTSVSPARTERELFDTPIANRETPLRILAPAKTLAEAPGSGWDFAWARFADAAEPLPDLGTLEFYRGPLDVVPNSEEPYGFIGWNRDEEHLAIKAVTREPSYELSMRFVGEDSSGMYRFLLDGPHKGNAFYRGASGAPIAGPDGTVVALLAHGEEQAENILTAVPLAKAIAAMRQQEE